MKNFLIVIPAFNEAKTIGKLIYKINRKNDVLVIDDGSSDGTDRIAKQYGAKVIKSKKNFGVDYSINLGFKYAIKKKYKYVITIDADGQHSVKDLNKIIKMLINRKKTDLIISVRSNLPRFSEKIFSLYTSIRFNISDLLSGLKAYNLDIFKNYGTYDTFKSIGTELSAFAIENDYKFKTIKINILKRKDSPRLGGILLGNFRILKALINLSFKNFK